MREDLASTVRFVVDIENNKSMVPCVSQIMTKIRYFPLNQNLTCAKRGMYVATCWVSNQQYIGQEVNEFSMGWSSHLSNWNKSDIRDDSNQMVLSRHDSVL